MKTSTPTKKTSTPTKKTLASSDSPTTVAKFSSATAKDSKKQAAEEVIKMNKKKKQDKMEMSNAITDNNEGKKKKKKKDDDEETQICSFPMTRVWRLVRRGEFDSNVDTIRSSQDAVFLINKASEMFLNRFTEDSFNKATSLIKDRSKKSPFLSYKHLSSIVSAGKPYEFLSDFVPEKVKAKEALKLWASTHSQSLINSTDALKTENAD